MRRVVASVQGTVYLTTGAWPVLHLRSFEAITGPKVDGWLVKTVGGLLVAVGIGELMAARRDTVSDEVAAIGAGAAMTLGSVAGIYAVRGRVRKVYLLDTAMEAAFVIAWAVATRRARRSMRQSEAPW
jgi:hypothetical protein